MTPATFCDRIIEPGLEALHRWGGPGYTPAVCCFALCVALQESGPKLEARYQGSPAYEPGPARGWWQFEEGGGVKGVLTHSASKTLAIRACHELFVIPQPRAVWRALEGNDMLACVFMRLLMLTDPAPIPIGADTAWECYMRLWRPGKPHPDTWADNWAVAVRETI